MAQTAQQTTPKTPKAVQRRRNRKPKQSPPLRFSVPSTLNNLRGFGSCLMGSLSHFAYERFMKFSVPPESRRAIASALVAIEWMKNRTVINFRADRYTLTPELDLIKAAQFRPSE